jgi:hypothetical protein
MKLALALVFAICGSACGSSSAPAVSLSTCSTGVSDKECLFVSGPFAGGAQSPCLAPTGATGACPSADLFGCCVTPEPEGSTDGFSATCFYDPTAGASAKASCTGSTQHWKSTLPVAGVDQ